MKRGKRQIQQPNNIFKSQQSTQNPVNSAFNGGSQDDSQKNLNKLSNVKNDEPTVIYQVQDKKEIKVIETVPKTNEDERKKRLDLLKQKYLKNSIPSTPQQPVQEDTQKITPSLPIRPLTANIMLEISPKSTVTFQKQSKIINKSSNQKEKTMMMDTQEHNEKSFKSANKSENDTSILKPTATSNQRSSEVLEQYKQSDQPILGTVNPRKIIPPPAQSKLGRAPPPKPFVSIPQPVHYPTQEQQPQNNSNQPIKNPIVSSPFAQKQTHEISQISTTQKKHGFSKEPTQTLKNGIKKIEQNSVFNVIQQWLNGNDNKPLSPSKTASKTARQNMIQKSEELSNGDQKLSGLILNFLLNNTVAYTEQQQNYVCQLVQHTKISQTSFLVFYAKCNQRSLEQHLPKILSDEIVSDILQIKSCFLPSELITLIKFYLVQTNESSKFQNIVHLITLFPDSQIIWNHIFKNHKFLTSQNIVSLLKVLKKILNESTSVYYLKLIQLLINFIDNSNTLEKILQHVNSIQLKNCYTEKKQVKLKIIERIDVAARGGHTNNMNNIQDAGKQKEKDKGSSGINIMGYVNKAIKKIASQIPEKNQTQPENKNVQQEEKSIVWDPVLNRYLINGKVPEDQYGNTNIQSTQSITKKKVPPPPPRIRPIPSTSTQEHIQQTQEQVQTYQINQQTQLKQSRIPVPPPPPRVAIKGMNAKKPKILANYS